MSTGRLVTLSSHTDLHEARRVRKKLVAAGIPAYISGEALALVSANPAAAFIKVNIAEEHLEHAHLVLDSSLQTDSGPQTDTVETGAPEDLSAAPDLAADASDGDTEGLATIAVFYDAVEAEQATILLREHGIPYALEGTSSGLTAILGTSVANLQLVVQEEDIDRACAILGFSVEPSDQDASSLDDGDDEREGDAGDRIFTHDSPIRSPVPPTMDRPRELLQPAPERRSDSNLVTYVPAAVSSMKAEPREEDDFDGAGLRGIMGTVFLVVFVFWLLRLIFLGF